jgi:DNA polymerase-1
MAPALLIDTFSVFFRAHHALPPMSTQTGEPTSALYGFSVLLLKLLREHPGAAFAFALDAPSATFRHDAFEGYKADRGPTPAPLQQQFERLRKLLDTFGVPVFRVPGFEADDVLASLAKRAREMAQPGLVVSGDRDLLQLAHGSIQVHFVGRRGKEALVYDEARVIARFGVPPVYLPAYVALIGDPSDNLPGVPGIGPATARKLLLARRNCLDLFSQVESIEPERVRHTLIAHREQILQTEHLARLRDDVPLGGDDPPWRVPARSALDALRELFEVLEFRSLLARLDRLRESA